MNSLNLLSFTPPIKPIFERACFDCHSNKTVYPWYHKIPGIKHLIESDIKEGKKHLDMSLDFPFKSHTTPREDLEAIENAITNNTMPPQRYKMLHWNSKLSQEEKDKIFEWILFSLINL